MIIGSFNLVVNVQKANNLSIGAKKNIDDK